MQSQAQPMMYPGLVQERIRSRTLPGALRLATSKSRPVPPPPRVLLVDDDPVFGRIMERAAAFRDVPLTYLASVNDLGQPADWRFDIAVVDFDLGSINGFELSDYIEEYAADTPVILVSQSKVLRWRKWPDNICDFVHKEKGPLTILEAAIEAHGVASLQREIWRTDPKPKV